MADTNKDRCEVLELCLSSRITLVRNNLRESRLSQLLTPPGVGMSPANRAKLESHITEMEALLDTGLNEMKRTYMIMGGLAVAKHNHPKICEQLPDSTVDMVSMVIDNALMAPKGIVGHQTEVSVGNRDLLALRKLDIKP